MDSQKKKFYEIGFLIKKWRGGAGKGRKNYHFKKKK